MILSPLSSSPYSSLCANLFQANSFASNVLTIIDAGFSSGKLCLVSFVCVTFPRVYSDRTSASDKTAQVRMYSPGTLVSGDIRFVRLFARVYLLSHYLSS